MDIRIRKYTEADAEEAVRIWNHIVEEGAAFPQLELLTAETGNRFFSEQSFTGIAYDGGGGEIVGLYILHPNAMPATRLNPSCGDTISERHW